MIVDVTPNRRRQATGIAIGVCRQPKVGINGFVIHSIETITSMAHIIKRQGLQHEMVDALGQQGAFYTSRLMYASELADAMQTMKAKAKGNTDLQRCATRARFAA